MTAEERFWAKVDTSGDCWLWTAGTNNAGYGKLRIGSTTNGSRGEVLVHRFSYELHFGQIPEGLTIDHLCRVRNCVNPQHLESVTHRENVLRGESPSAKRARQTHCIHGHPFSEENTYLQGHHRICRICKRLKWARWAAKRDAHTPKPAAPCGPSQPAEHDGARTGVDITPPAGGAAERWGMLPDGEEP